MKNLLAFAFLFGMSGITYAQTTHFVDVSNFVMSPAVLNIEPNDIVTFTNTGGFHNVAATDNSFRCANGCDGDGMGGNGNPAGAGWSFSITFTTPSTTIDYLCEVHTNMTGQIIVGTSVPIELVSFEALVQDGTVELFWETATELNNSGFEIQHNRDSDIWEPIAFIEGAGSTTEHQNYRYTLEGIESGAHSFRLMQVDFDGSISFSPVVETWLDLPSEFSFSEAYPNPFHPSTHFTLTLQDDQQVRVAVFNGHGHEIAVLHDGLLAGKTKHWFTYDATGRASGAYFIRVVGELFSRSKQVFLVN